MCEIVVMKTSLIDALGGSAAVAKALGVSLSAVSNWRSRPIPWRWRPALAALARREGVELPDDFLTANPAVERAA